MANETVRQALCPNARGLLGAMEVQVALGPESDFHLRVLLLQFQLKLGLRLSQVASIHGRTLLVNSRELQRIEK